MTEQAVTAAQPGATVTAPASAAPFVSDTSGMSPSQAAAMKYVDTVRAAIARDPTGAGTLKLRDQNREALAHVFHGAQAPAWLKAEMGQPKGAEEIARGARPVDERSLESSLAPQFQPASEADVAGLVQGAVMTTSLPREHAEIAAQFALEAQLPASVAKGLLSRLAHHHSHGYELRGELSEAEQADLAQEMARSLGGEQKAANEIRLARAYLSSVGGEKLLDAVDKYAGSLGLDPRVILQLSMLARAKGIQ